MTMGRHGNRLHHLATPCIPHGCSLSLRAELHPAEPGRGSDRGLGGGLRGEQGRGGVAAGGGGDPEFRWISAALGRPAGRGGMGRGGTDSHPCESMSNDYRASSDHPPHLP